MEITVIPSDLSHADCWVVTVEGRGSDPDFKNKEVVYRGKNADTAKRTLIEALALAAIYPGGKRRPFSNTFDYSHILVPAVPYQIRMRRFFGPPAKGGARTPHVTLIATPPLKAQEFRSSTRKGGSWPPRHPCPQRKRPS